MLAAADGNTPFEFAYSTATAANVLLAMEQYEQAEPFAEQALELSEKDQFPLVAVWARCLVGRVRAELGRSAEGIELIRQGIAGLPEVAGPGFIGYYFLHLACALERADSIADALAAVEQAFRAKSYPDLELFAFLRRGQLRIKQGQAELAEVDLRRAIALAQKIDAKAAQLRATISLARLFETQGRPDEARSMLAEIYTWFSEGFDVADLKNARALLEQLNV